MINSRQIRPPAAIAQHARPKDQHRAPLALRVSHDVIEPLPDRLGASQIMVLVEQLVAVLQLVRLSRSYLQTLKDGLLLGIRFANGSAHGPELEKSRDRCPAKTPYLLLLNDLWSEVNLRCVRDCSRKVGPGLSHGQQESGR